MTVVISPDAPGSEPTIELEGAITGTESCGEVCIDSDSTKITIIEPDLDVDSDNNNGNNPPDRNEAEDSVEDATPGKSLCVNHNDTDEDGTPDNSQEPPPVGDPDLVPMVAEVNLNTTADSRWKLVYDAAIVQVYKNDRTTIIPSGQVSTGPLSPNPSNFWIEGLAPSAGTSIKFEIDEEGDGTFDCSDSVVVSTPTNYDTVEIKYKTFIQCEVAGPTLWGDPILYDFFAGDNRPFGYAFSSGASRTFQLASLTVDPSNTENGQVGSVLQAKGITRGYDDDPDGSDVVLLPAPTCGGECSYTFVPGATAECTAQDPTPGDDGQLSMNFERVSSSEVDLIVAVGAGDQCETLVPAIDVALTLHFRQRCVDGDLQPMEYKIAGSYDGYPWHELYLNGGLVFKHDPCLTGEGPMSMFPPMEHVVETESPELSDWQPVPAP